MGDTELIDATTAAQRLGVKTSSLYAYVSRGFVRSHRRPGTRGSWFDPVEIEELGKIKGRERSTALDFAVGTAITLIDGGRLWYRGVDATWLGRHAAFESVCQLLWAGDLDYRPFTQGAKAVDAVRRATAALGPEARLIDRVALTVSVAAAADHLRFDLSPASVAHSGRALLATMVDALPERATNVPVLTLAEGERRKNSLAGRLWIRLAPPQGSAAGVAALNEVLVLLADHELATSTLAARVAASTRANPYSVVSAALGAFDGSLHGTASEEVVAVLEEAYGPAGVTGAVAGRLRRGQPMPGFGHPIYGGGDPRAVAMLETLNRLAGLNRRRMSERLAVVKEVLALAGTKSKAAPNSDFGLGAFVFVTGLPNDAGEAIFAIARTAGWVAHALEEYREEPLRFRSRAYYTGPAPGSGS